MFADCMRDREVCIGTDEGRFEASDDGTSPGVEIRGSRSKSEFLAGYVGLRMQS